MNYQEQLKELYAKGYSIIGTVMTFEFSYNTLPKTTLAATFYLTASSLITFPVAYLLDNATAENLDLVANMLLSTAENMPYDDEPAFGMLF